jgi:hypothetical protein
LSDQPKSEWLDKDANPWLNAKIVARQQKQKGRNGNAVLTIVRTAFYLKPPKNKLR